MNEQLWHAELPQLLENKTALPKYRVLANAVAAAIDSGQLRRDEQLPTVRELAGQLGVSGTTIAAAYRILAQQKLISGKVGSGTRVAGGVVQNPTSALPSVQLGENGFSKPPLWRRRTQTNHIATLSRAFPQAQNFASGTPNPALLPLEVLKRAWVKAAMQVSTLTLQYAGPTPVAALSDQLLKRLEADLIPVTAADLVIGSSAQQMMALSIQIASTMFQKAQLLVGVEEPGYPTLFDSYERLGHRLVGIEVDAEGAIPTSVEDALNKGVTALVFTPRAHNPTGVSWSPTRLSALTEVLAAYPKVLIIEDDQFADAANTQVGSLLHDPRLENRVIYVRSFSKVIAPDLRLAAAVARPALRSLLVEGKFYTDGWSSRFSQSALAYAFADGELSSAITFARETYNRRRQALIEALNMHADVGELDVFPSVDGVNVWLKLKNGASATEVAERAASAGVLVATGEPFYVRIGRDDALRINSGMINDEAITLVSEKVITALKDTATSIPFRFSHHSL